MNIFKKINKQIQKYLAKKIIKFINRFDKKLLFDIYYDFKRATLNLPDDVVLGKDAYIFPDVKIFNNCKIGKKTSIQSYTVLYPNTIIGSYCSIAKNVSINTGQHTASALTTHFQLNDPRFNEEINTSVIGNDVWIGRNVVIMDGINVGDGAILGSNAVVTKDIPPYAVAVGVPAKVIKYRFSEEIIKQLLELKWWELKEEQLKDLPFHNVEECIIKLKEIRRVKTNV